MCMVRLALLNPLSVVISVCLYALIRGLSGLWCDQYNMDGWLAPKEERRSDKGDHTNNWNDPPSAATPPCPRSIFPCFKAYSRTSISAKTSTANARSLFYPWGITMSVGQNLANGFLNADKISRINPHTRSQS